MNITQIARQVTDFSFTLSQIDLEKYLANPDQWAADVRAQLNGAAPVAGGGAHMKADPKGAAGPGRRSSKKSARAKASKLTLTCPVCEKPFTQPGRLANHLKKMHPDHAA